MFFAVGPSNSLNKEGVGYFNLYHSQGKVTDDKLVIFFPENRL